MDMSSTPDPMQQTQSLTDKSRSAARESLFLLGKLWLDSERSTEVRIRNLSATGMMVEIKEYTAVGDVIHIEIKGLGKLAGTIAWIAEKRIGIALQRQIDPSLARQQVRGSLHVPDHLKQQPPVRPGFKLG
jgi:PilZ domain